MSVPSVSKISYGYCQCGCGQKTWIATGTNKRMKFVKNEPVRFIKGHQNVRPRRYPYIADGVVQIPLATGEHAIASVCDFPHIEGRFFTTDGRYVITNIKRKTVKLHVLILDCPVGLQRDHINRNRLDNRRENLRLCTQHANCGNKPLSKNNTSGFKGVSKFGWRWRVYVRHKGEVFYGGIHDDIKDAARAFNTIAKRIWGEFAYQNEVEG